MAFTLPRWFVKYKLPHLLMWILVMGFSFLAYFNPAKGVMGQVVNAICVSGLQTIPFYFAAYVLVPRLLYRRQFTAFIIAFIVLVCTMGLFTLFVTRLADRAFAHEKDILPTWTIMGPSISLFIWNSILAAFGSSGLKILSDRFRIEKKLHMVEKEKITTELSFLRSQINPHFLFNIMNTIYFQIEKTNSEARLSVEKFSEMLRYQLYECTTDKIRIGKEVNYIKNYIAIQTLRMEKESDIRLSTEGELEQFFIAPFLILPIVENAFKHVSNFKEPNDNKIYVSLSTTNDGIFQVEAINTFEQDYSAKHLLQSGGLGMQNLKRRLELLYPERHELLITRLGNTYQTILKLHYDN